MPLPLRGAPTLVGLPYDASSSFERGAAEGPFRIRAEIFSPAGNVFSEDLRDLSAPGALSDAGDLELPATTEAHALVEAAIARRVASGRRPLCLGGDHSLTYPILRGLNPDREPLTILHVDAHGDLYDVFEGDRMSHACPFARILEAGLCQRLVQVGIRTLTPHQCDQIQRFGVETIDMRAWAQGLRPVVEGPVYVSIDLDGLDPSRRPRRRPSRARRADRPRGADADPGPRRASGRRRRRRAQPTARPRRRHGAGGSQDRARARRGDAAHRRVLGGSGPPGKVGWGVRTRAFAISPG